MPRKRQHPGEVLALNLEPKERAQVRKLHEQWDTGVRAVAYIKSTLGCTLREAMDVDYYLTFTVE